MQTFGPSRGHHRDSPGTADRGRAAGWLPRALIEHGRALWRATAAGARIFWFVASLPTDEVKLERSADGIVALTGGASRITDALDL
jgi:hypothetical protein